MDLISVIIPVYNTEKYLDRCVESVINQSYPEIEIILVDDGSTDSSGEKCDELARREKRIRVIHQKNLGIGMARNNALGIAQGDFVCFLDSDDYILNDIIYKMYIAVTKYRADLVCCGYESGHRKELASKKVEVWSGYEACKRMFIRRGINSAAWCKLYKKAVLQGIQYLNTPYEDVPVTYQILLRCRKVVSLGESGYYIEKRPNSTTRKLFSHDQLLHVILSKSVMNKIEQDYADLRPYAQTFYYNAIIDTAERAEVSDKESSDAVEAYKEIQRLFRENQRNILRNPYIKTRKRIICILIILNMYKFCYKIVNCKLMNSQEIKNMKKIAILSWYGRANAGGVERVVGLLEDILSKQYNCKIVDQDIVKHYYKGRKLLYDSKIGRMLLLSFVARELRKSGFFLIGNGFNAPFVQKDICIAHGNMYGLKSALNQFVWGGSTIFEALSMKKSNRIIAVSQETKKALTEKYRIRENKIDVIENCVDCKVFFPLKQNQNGLTIIFCGRLEDGKGIDRLFALAKKIDGKNNIKLKIATPVDDNVEMFSNLKNTEICVGLDYSQMNQFYNSGNVMFFPSKFEGFEMVTGECLAAGIPVVGNYVGAIKELIDEDFPGVFIAKSDEEELIVQLRSIAMQFQSIHKRELLHETVNERLGKEQYANKICAILKRCIDI